MCLPGLSPTHNDTLLELLLDKNSFFFFLNGGAWTIARRLWYQQMWCFYVFYRKSGLGIGCYAEKKFWQEQKMQTFLRLRAVNVLCLSPFWHQRDFSPFFGGETTAHSPSEMLKRVMWWVERWLQVKCGTDRARVYRNKNSSFFLPLKSQHKLVFTGLNEENLHQLQQMQHSGFTLVDLKS